jgi:lipoate-protein ligase A
MRRDEMLLRECHLAVSGDGPRLAFPALRFYHWDPPCISLGRNQDLRNPRHGHIDEDAACRLGVDLVRRPSGGRAILHYHDLTYALVMPTTSDDVSSSHKVIAGGLAGGLRMLGVPVDDEMAVMPSHRNPADCFAAVAGADLQACGAKVMGSAQRRSGRALLEHGTLYLTSPDPLYTEVFGQPFGGSVTALDALLGCVPTFEEVAEALTQGLEIALGVEFRLDEG